MASLLDLYTKKVPTTGNANTKGVDKTPIGVEQPFDPSMDLSAKDLTKPRKGALGQGTGGYDTKKIYSTSIKNK
jgi:hypothetical protein